MLLAVSALAGGAIEASDGRIGTVTDSLFDDESWKIRWLVVDTGGWLPGRKVLIHPSAIARSDLAHPPSGGLGMMRTASHLELPVTLTKKQIEQSPDIREDQPLSRQMESHLHDYFGWDPYWGDSYFGRGAIASPLGAPPLFAGAAPREAADAEFHPGDGDPHLQSAAAVAGYHIHATDGAIGHIENFLADDANWDIRYLIIDTRNWWPGRHVLIAPYAVREIDWLGRQIRLDVTRDQVRQSPPWDPIAMIDRAHEERLHRHYGWPGYGW